MDPRGIGALVTGGGRRVGAAIARALGAAGASVAVHYHASREGADAVCAAIGAGGGVAVPVGADLADDGARARLVREAESAVGPIRILVNSAALFERVPFEQTGAAAWQKLLTLNLVAPAELIRLALPSLRKGGVVVNILDIAALSPWPGQAPYSSAKAGLAMLTQTLAVELAPTVRVVGIAPGTVLFPEDYTVAEKAAVTGRIPLGRIGAPEDIAAAVMSLVAADFVTGIVLPVDGGRLAQREGPL